MYRGMKIGYKSTILWFAGGSLGLLLLATICMYLIAEALPTTAILIPVVGWALMVGAYYAFPVVRWYWDYPYGGTFSVEVRPCQKISVGTQLTLYETTLTCEACNLDYLLPNKTQALYQGHIDLDGLVVDAITLLIPLECPHCTNALKTLAFPCSAPGFSYKLPSHD